MSTLNGASHVCRDGDVMYLFTCEKAGTCILGALKRGHWNVPSGLVQSKEGAESAFGRSELRGALFEIHCVINILCGAGRSEVTMARRCMHVGCRARRDRPPSLGTCELNLRVVLAKCLRPSLFEK